MNGQNGAPGVTGPTGPAGGADADWIQGTGKVYNLKDKVGIGISGPSEKLSVSGNVKITGDYMYASPKEHYTNVGAGLSVMLDTSPTTQITTLADQTVVYVGRIDKVPSSMSR